MESKFKAFMEGYFFPESTLAKKRAQKQDELGDIILRIREKQVEKYKEINANHIKQRKALLNGK